MRASVPPMIAACNESTEGWRLDRLARVRAALASKGLDRHEIASLYDAKGSLIVGWQWAPSSHQRDVVEAAWRDENECVVEHETLTVETPRGEA